MSRSQSQELQRLCESTLWDDTLKFSELLRYVARAARRGASSEVAYNVASIIQENPMKKRKEPRADDSFKCYHCGRPGHTVSRCFKKFLETRKRQEGNQKEPEGRRVLPK